MSPLGGAAAARALRGSVARRSLASFVLKAVGVAVTFVYSLILARLLGADEYGLYEYVIAWTTILATLSAFGLDKLLVRAFPTAGETGDWSHARGLFRWATAIVLGTSCGVAIVMAGAARLLDDGADTYLSFLAGCLVLPLMSLAIVWSGALQGLHRIVEGQLGIILVRPLASLALVLVAVGTGVFAPTAATALGAFAMAAVLAVVTTWGFLHARLPTRFRDVGPTYDRRHWLAAAMPIMIMSGFTIANSRMGTVVLGALAGAESAGIYAVLTRGSDLIAFALVAVNAAVAPSFAGLQAAGDHARFQRTVTRSARLIFLLSLPIALGLLVFGHVYLQLFGDTFSAGVPGLRIAVLGQLVNVSMGSVGVLLVMTGHERASMWGFATAALVNVGLCFLLVPMFGIAGAASAGAVSTTLWNVLLARVVYRRLGLHATIVGAPSR